jgi:hypothetical protein
LQDALALGRLQGRIGHQAGIVIVECHPNQANVHVAVECRILALPAHPNYVLEFKFDDGRPLGLLDPVSLR